jgi:flagellar basal-body rod modification protein FlgD
MASVNPTGALGTGSITSAIAGDQTMGRDAFLKLLVAQLKNQDPLEPQPNTEFVAQLAQFSSLEQSMGINERLDMLSLQNQGMANTGVISLVGKTVTVKGSILTLDGSGSPAPVSFTLNGASETTDLVIRDQSGREVRRMELGSRAAGSINTTWDGRDNTGLVQPAGAYAVSIEAKQDGSPVSASTETSGLVNAVSFDQGYPVLQLSNGTAVPVADLLRVEPAPIAP